MRSERFCFSNRFFNAFFTAAATATASPPLHLNATFFSEPMQQWVTPRRYPYSSPWKWERVWGGPRVRSSPPLPCTRVKSVCDMSGSGEFNLYSFQSVTHSRAAPVSGYCMVREASPFLSISTVYATPPPSINAMKLEDPYEVQKLCAPGSILAVGS